ncbi:hypothetical protein PVAND_012184 [Polypedilum vanderplanki]|uniref:Uncharacterized protein n=1 Tax=Polypedilum vanderplanki TaxID=319348 RepID=A0A9J6CLZ9_POLVA|nr:hypothetical protein PVAND_012184 [Polypedilum vanderplanki]
MKSKEILRKRKRKSPLIARKFKIKREKFLLNKIVENLVQFIFLGISLYSNIITYSKELLHHSALKFTTFCKENLEKENTLLIIHENDDFLPNENFDLEHVVREIEESNESYMPLIYLMHLYGRFGLTWSITTEPGIPFLHTLFENVRGISEEVVNELRAFDCHDEIVNEIEEFMSFSLSLDAEAVRNFELNGWLSRWEIFILPDGRYKIRAKFEEQQINLLNVSNKFIMGEGSTNEPLIYSQKIRIYKSDIGFRTLSTTRRNDSIADFLCNLGHCYFTNLSYNAFVEAEVEAEQELEEVRSEDSNESREQEEEEEAENDDEAESCHHSSQESTNEIEVTVGELQYKEISSDEEDL